MQFVTRITTRIFENYLHKCLRYLQQISETEPENAYYDNDDDYDDDNNDNTVIVFA